ncbi:C-type lectin domain family 4 member M [Anabarilius grahami]|uniref:C-type lectin domain family 4 member M n=1 Tax=Anabarilius grahami TaxID=495550 RepID=A0A3N0YQT5_ANAGA|nr:C-type lectin domain family 4 member M [Anabarilius grahami]
MHREDGQTTDVYENDGVIKGKIGKEITNAMQEAPEQLQRVWCCCVFFCYLQPQCWPSCFTLCHAQERQLTNNTNLTEERIQLQISNTDLIKEKDQLQTRNNNITKEKVQLQTKNINLTRQRDQLQLRNTDLTRTRDQLQIRNIELTNERDGLSSNNLVLIKQRDQLNKEKNELLKCLSEKDGWTYYKSNLYLLSSEMMSWTESRRYCTERGADLFIINNREEQNFAIWKMSAGVRVWIGLNDIDVKNMWKWVDGSTLTSSFWASDEPTGQRRENCALTHGSGWADYPCNDYFQCICEKRILN